MRKKTDARILKLKRHIALERPEFRKDAKPAPPSAEEIAAAIAAGRFHKIEGKTR